MTAAHPFDQVMDGGPYGAILADPPWKFESWSAKGNGRSADQHYSCMPTADIAALPVADIAAPDCALFLWATWPRLPDALRVIEAWGFRYSTLAFCWVKVRRGDNGGASLFHCPDDAVLGNGYWTRANTEPCLFARQGSPARLSRKVRQVLLEDNAVLAPRRQHSRKPDETLERIEALVPGPYCELFSRASHPGWAAWGNEVGKFGSTA